MDALLADFVWTDKHGQGRNVFALFRRVLMLDTVPQEATIHLIADSRYRLRVNGAIVGYGPIRFHPRHPEYDSYNLAPHLRPGENVLAVEVNAFGSNSFETLPSFGGFLAWGTCSDHDLATPGDWKALRATAWDAWATPHSFAQAPTEVLDLRALPAGWDLPGFDDAAWGPPVRHLRPDNWGLPAPRSIPPYRNDLQPLREIDRFGIRDDEERWGFRVPSLGEPIGGRTPRVRFRLELESPEDQEVELGFFWGPVRLNRVELKGEKDPVRGCRLNARVPLRKGINEIVGDPECLSEAWPFLVGWPRSAGVRAVRAALSEPYAGEPGPLVDLPIEPDVPPPAPARMMGWDVPDRERSSSSQGVVFDFGQEFIGHVALNVEGPAGAVVDVCVDEALRPDGHIAIYRAQHNVANADRIVLRGGRETVEMFRTRGGRYVQATVRHPEAIVHGAQIRLTLADLPREGRFACDDETLNWAWETGAHTLEASTEDAFVDPWRERGVYIGDTLVEHLVARAVTADDSVTRRCLRLWAQCQLPDGRLQNTVPAWLDHPHLDFSLLWVILLRDVWAWSGDVDLVRELWPCARRVLHSLAILEEGGRRNGERPLGEPAEGILWSADGQHVFLDWAARDDDRTGISGGLNAFRIGALDAMAELAGAIGEDAAPWRAEAGVVRGAFQSLWDPARGRYAASRQGGQLRSEPAAHANVLALLYRATTPETEPLVLELVRRRLAANVAQEPGYIELYFLYFACQALLDRGWVGNVEDVMRDHAASLRAQGMWAYPETLHRGGTASMCHGWAASPTYFLSTTTLGVRPARPGDPNRLVVAPASERLSRAEGVFPHPRGPVSVAWHVEGETLRVRVEAPMGVEVEVKPEGRLAALKLERAQD